ncbi:MAG: hydroxylamine oxidase [candidate division Zixibacteria bacterium]|nr:hydroxylamine oxidase [candidate division Zixibacteria bacterium]
MRSTRKGRTRIHKRLFSVLITFFICSANAGADAPVSETTEACLECHASITPGIVADWQNSRHAQVAPAEAVTRDVINRRISVDEIPAGLAEYAVGCAECHTLNPEKHNDNFDHNDYPVHTVVTPPDCAVCHPVEEAQYRENIMSWAQVNLSENQLYQSMMQTINGMQHFRDYKMIFDEADETVNEQSCYFCHGTEVTVSGLETRETDLGEMAFPVLTGWPNVGVGRINPDGSQGSCSPCHTRHQFSIEVARKPYTCAECHKGPDVPAYPVYSVSKHGNIFSSSGDKWDFVNVPWVLGADFTAPTCAVCHVSLVVNEDEEIIAERTHRMNDRLDRRIFGLIYAHPHPKSPRTSIISNKNGLPLPTELTGEPVAEFLIDSTEQVQRNTSLKKVCLACHGEQWVAGHFEGLRKTIEETNAVTLTATDIISQIWRDGLAQGLPQGANVFDEAVEKMWVEQWLFFANSTRFAAAMGGADYGVFANGRWYQSKNIRQMHDWLQMRRELRK